MWRPRRSVCSVWVSCCCIATITSCPRCMMPLGSTDQCRSAPCEVTHISGFGWLLTQLIQPATVPHVIHPSPETKKLAWTCFHGDGRGEERRHAPMCNAKSSLFCLRWLLISLWPKQVSRLIPVSRGRAGHAAHIERELQNNMTTGIDRGKGEELEPSLQLSLPP